MDFGPAPGLPHLAWEAGGPVARARHPPASHGERHTDGSPSASSPRLRGVCSFGTLLALESVERPLDLSSPLPRGHDGERTTRRSELVPRDERRVSVRRRTFSHDCNGGSPHLIARSDAFSNALRVGKDREAGIDRQRSGNGCSVRHIHAGVPEDFAGCVHDAVRAGIPSWLTNSASTRRHPFRCMIACSSAFVSR